MLRFVACLVLLGTIFPGCAEQSSPGTVDVTIGGETFTLEIVADDEKRERGLMGRETIPADGGMIFIFPDVGPRSFWMAHCLTDIDILFLDSRGRVTAVHEMLVEPPQLAEETEPEYQLRLTSYSSLLPAQFAIELKAGSIDRLGIRPRDKIELDLDRLKALAQ